MHRTERPPSITSETTRNRLFAYGAHAEREPTGYPAYRFIWRHRTTPVTGPAHGYGRAKELAH